MTTYKSEPGQNGAERLLSARQIPALPILAVAPNMRLAAQDAGISHSTLYRWLRSDHFRAELNRLTTEAADFTRQEFQSLTRKSFRALNELAENPDPNVRLRACIFIAFMGSREGKTDSIHEDAPIPFDQTET